MPGSLPPVASMYSLDLPARLGSNRHGEDEEDDSQSGVLDFKQFCDLVRQRELGEHSQQELRQRFKALDSAGIGQIQMHDYLIASLRLALSKSVGEISLRFQQWDVDRSGTVDLKEFRRAVRLMGFADIRDEHIDEVFREIDDDGSGEISLAEITRRLKKFAGVGINQVHDLRRVAGGRKGGALSTAMKLDMTSGVPLNEQLRVLLTRSLVRVIDLFRDWDEDGNGSVDRDEFYRALTALGVSTTKETSDTLFADLDPDGSGTIEYKELNTLCRRRISIERQKLRRTRSEIMPPGFSRSDLQRSLGPNGVVQAEPGAVPIPFASRSTLFDFRDMRQGSKVLTRSTSVIKIGDPTLAQASGMKLGYGLQVSGEIIPDMWVRPAALDLVAEMWCKPRHGITAERYQAHRGPIHSAVCTPVAVRAKRERAKPKRLPPMQINVPPPINVNL